MIIVNDLTVQVKNQLLLQSVSCTLLPGRITVFIGQSGAGKTTLLKSLVGLIPIQQGAITINGQLLNTLSPSQKSKEIGFVFQGFNLFPHMSVLQNCIDPLLIHGIDVAHAKERAFTVLQELEMNTMAEKYPAQLSGGQQQRVAIARALCLRPKVLLLDEPTASLDPLNTDILVVILQKLVQQGLTIGVSSQDMSFVRAIFDRVYYIRAGEIAEYCDTKEMLNRCPLIQSFV